MFEKKITLIQPDKFLAVPMGLLYIAGALEKNGYEVEITEVGEPGDVLLDKDSGFFRRISNKIIGLSFFSSQIERAKHIIEGIRHNVKDAIIICGGIHTCFLPEDSLLAGADYAVVGEGEETIIELLNLLAKGQPVYNVRGIAYKDSSGMIVRTPPRPLIKELSSIPFPAYHLIDSGRFTRRNYLIRGLWLKCAHILTSRGCPSKCTFCAAARLYGRTVRDRPITGIIEELNLLVANYGINAFHIIDDNFLLKGKRVEEFCDKLRAMPYKFKWGSQSRVDTLTEGMVVNLKKSGCVQIEFGVESGSQRVLEALNKDIKVEEIERAFELCKKHKMRTLANIMIGNPGEEREDIKKTAELLRRIKPTFTVYGFLVPFPGSDIYDSLRSKGLIGNDSDLARIATEDPLAMFNFTKEELLLIMKSFHKSYPAIFGYLIQPLFLFDMFNYSVKAPLSLLRILKLLAKGDNIGARNLFTKVYSLN